MEYNWLNPLWKRMEAKNKQEYYQSKFARYMHSFHHSGVNRFNVYGGKNHENGKFTLKNILELELLLKDVENRVGANIELFKVNPLAFEKSNLRKEAFEQVCKDFVSIQDWFTPKSAFQEESFHGFTSFYKKFIKDLSTIASSLIVASKKMTEVTWETCSPHLEFDYNKAYYSATLLCSFEPLGLKPQFLFSLILWRSTAKENIEDNIRPF
ncbi:hypothetical protein M9H77_18662 [Catharanthus roseus]|uniref:Uncharacterized protein n=1 Tax=Catharanthus roseus TaxID=4058 RepID=A0ACC0B813_CATRO|nr:hypothetical protein M9H77_18662 [Catharanthus roseus]